MQNVNNEVEVLKINKILSPRCHLCFTFTEQDTDALFQNYAIFYCWNKAVFP